MNLEAERLRRLAVIVRAEREITTATRLAYAELLRLIAADVLDGRAPVVAALPETNRNRNQVNAAWLLLLLRIKKPILKLFRSRFSASGAPKNGEAAAVASYLTAIDVHLKAVPAEVYTELDKIVASCIKHGATEDQIKASLARELTPGHAEYEARLDAISTRVGRTQATSAFNAGEDAGWRNVAAAQRSKLTKTWITLGDAKVRISHIEAEGQTVPADQHFTVGGEQAMYPGDPRLSPQESTNCRCSAVYSTNAIIASVEEDHEANEALPGVWRNEAGRTVPCKEGPSGRSGVAVQGLRETEVANTEGQGTDAPGQPEAEVRDHAGTMGNDVPRAGPSVRVVSGRQRTGTETLDDGSLSRDRAAARNSLHPVQHSTGVRGSGLADAGPRDDQAVLDVTMPTETALPDGWRGPIAALDVPTSDRRMLATPPDGVIKTRAYPLTLTRNHVGDPTGYPCIGSVDNVWMQDGLLWGEGRFDLGGEDGQEAARQLAGAFINRMSIDPVDVTGELRMYDPEDKVVDPEAAQKIYEENGYELPEGYTEVMVFADWTLAGLAMVPIPAYTQAAVDPVFGYEPTAPRQEAVVVVASVGGQIFARKFFEYSATGPTKLTVTDDGHVYGHVREYGACYQMGSGQGDGGYCIEPPLSACGYAKFHAHSAKMDDGSIIDVGAITFGDGHESRGGLLASRRHYDNVSTMAAKVVATEDEWGVFVTGEVLDAYRDTAYDLLLSPLSGHWEPDADNNNHLEMLAAHIVVAPGFSPRRIVASFDENGEATCIIATTYPSQKGSAFGTLVTSGPSTRALVAAAMADQRRAAKLAKRAGVDPAARVERALARIGR